MTICVRQPGMLTTVQDCGRYGSQKYGVIVSGAMDLLSLRIANLLVGNQQDEATLEMTVLGATLEFEEDQLVAITGGDFQPTIDGNPAPMWRPILIRQGSILQCKSVIRGCRAYIAFAGGIQLPTVLGSKSTYVKAALGGFEGRALKKEDVLTCGTPSATGRAFQRQLETQTMPLPWSVDANAFFRFQQTETIRFIEGSEYARFTEDSQKTFERQPYSLTMEADRMGYRLQGEALQLSETFELLSEGVTYGTIQVPSNGQPIILMADRQTTGGYPKIGQVISADLPKLAQLQPKATIHFQKVTLQEAERALIEQHQQLTELAVAIQLKGQRNNEETTA